MKALLRIDASARIDGSTTRELADYYQSQWQDAHPEGSVLQRCLATDPVPHLSQETIAAFHHGSEAIQGNLALSTALIDELQWAEHVLISSPLYNLNLPSTLKAYFDHIVRSGLTFEVQDGDYRGLLQGTSATLITARGGLSSAEYIDDFQAGYLRAILAFVGIDLVDVVSLEGMALGREARSQQLSAARRQVEGLFDCTPTPRWRGELDAADRHQIDTLRCGQAQAIVNGDARAYAELCTDDIQLLIPGQDVISGRDAFLQAEEKLFSQATFTHFEKYPIQIERCGDIAVENGRQEAKAHHEAAGGVFSARQKYTHILRQTSAGWRFSLLMSNPSE